MVETEAQAQMLKESVNITDFCQHICAPTSENVWPLIFWTKDSPDDQSPTPDKIVSIFTSNFLL
jgi:hypothetical protein